MSRKVAPKIIDLKKLSFWLSIVLLLVNGILFFAFWRHELALNLSHFFSQNFKSVIIQMLVGYVILVVAFIFGIVLHELIHGLCFAFFCKKGFKSIRFGIRKNPLVFYTHCAEPLKRIPFWIGTLAPCAILGIIPTLIGQTIGSLGLIVFGFLFTAFSVGDIYLVWEAGVLKKTDVVLDDPENIGFMIVDSEKELDF